MMEQYYIRVCQRILHFCYAKNWRYAFSFNPGEEEPPLPKEAADELKKQIEEKDRNGGQAALQSTSNGAGIYCILMLTIPCVHAPDIFLLSL